MVEGVELSRGRCEEVELSEEFGGGGRGGFKGWKVSAKVLIVLCGTKCAPRYTYSLGSQQHK